MIGQKAQSPSEADLEDFEYERSMLVEEAFLEEMSTAAELVELCLVNDVGKRMVSVFLGTAKCDTVKYHLGGVQADLMLECLPAFVAASGGQIVSAKRVEHHQEITDAVYRTVRVGGDSRRILQEGHLFIWLGQERVVVVAGCGPYGNLLITIHSNADSTEFGKRWFDYGRQNNYFRGRAFFADGKLIERKKTYSWTDILLPDHTKAVVRTHVEDFLKYRDELKALGVKARRGVILSGPPGTGKTLLGKILADLLNISFLWVLPRHIQNPGSFAEILSLARFVSPTVVFLEDLDLFGEERHCGGGMGLGELMNQLDGAAENEDIIAIATTNRLEVVEQALRNRPGRFDRVVKFEAMDAGCRRSLLQRLLAKKGISAEDVEYLTCATEEFTGAQVEEVANTLCILAVQAARGSAGGDPGVEVPMGRDLLDAALAEVRTEPQTRFGFISS